MSEGNLLSVVDEERKSGGRVCDKGSGGGGRLKFDVRIKLELTMYTMENGKQILSNGDV